MGPRAERLDLNRVAIFLQVAEAQGVSAAAAKAKLPKSSVSRALSQLEDELGVELVVRRTKHFQLTEAGQDFYDAAAKGIAAVSDARDRLRRDTSIPSGKLTIAAPPMFASHIVVPAIAAFVEKYPDMEIQLAVTASPVSPGDGFDIVLALGDLEDSSARVRKLGATDSGIYASPEYLVKYGTPKRPIDLSGHLCILNSRMRKRSQWRLSGPAGTVEVAVRGRIVVDDVFSGMAACASGAGLFPLATHMAAADATARSLQRVLPEFTMRGEPLQLVYAASRHVPRRISMFCDAIEERAKTSCPRPSTL